jgi:hypothetical protein
VVQRVQTPHAGRILPLLSSRVFCTFALILAIITSLIVATSLASGQTIPNNGTGTQKAKDLRVYDSDFFSIKYPTSWFVSAERGISDLPGASGVTLLDQIDMNHNNRVTARSDIGRSIIAISVIPKTVIPIDTSNIDISEILNSFINYSYSSKKLSESGGQLLTDNSTYLAGYFARSISYVSNVHPGGTYNFMVFSTHRDSIYQIAYGAPLSKYQKELSEVKSILSSFMFKEPKVSTASSPIEVNI